METNPVLIETSVLIRHFRTPPTAMSAYRKAVRKYIPLSLSVITVYEIEFGAVLDYRSLTLMGCDMGGFMKQAMG